MKKTLSILAVLLMFGLFTNAQMLTPEQEARYNKYESEFWSGASLVKLIDAVSFKPRYNEVQGDIQVFKAALLSLSDKGIEQMNRDANYLLAKKYNDYYEVWNIFYTKITPDRWERNAKGMICLMLIDRTAKRL